MKSDDPARSQIIARLGMKESGMALWVQENVTISPLGFRDLSPHFLTPPLEDRFNVSLGKMSEPV